MPYIPRQASIIGKADACGGGMKKAGLVARTEFPRVNAHYLKTNTVQMMPTFQLSCCNGVRGRVYGVRIVHGRPTPIG